MEYSESVKYSTRTIIQEVILPGLSELVESDSDNTDKYKKLIDLYTDAEEQIDNNKLPYKALLGPTMFLDIAGMYDSLVYKGIVVVSNTVDSVVRGKMHYAAAF